VNTKSRKDYYQAKSKNLTELELYKSICDHAPVGIEIYNRDGFLLSANHQVRRIFGIDESIKAISFNLFDDPNISEETKRLLRAGSATHNETLYDFELVKKHHLFPTTGSGKIILDIASRPIHDSDGDETVGYVVHLQDITARKKAEEKMQIAQNLLQACLGSAENLDIFVIDKDFKYLYFNSCHQRTMLQLYGKKANLEISVLDIIQDENERKKVQDLFAQIFAGRTFECVSEYGTLERQIWESKYNPIYNQNFEIIGASCFSSNVTERKKTEADLQESEYLFKESQRAASIGSYKTDFTLGQWKSSKILDRIFGIDETYSRSVAGWQELVHPDERETLNRYWSEEIFQKRQPFNREYRIIRKADAEVRWIHGLGEVSFDLEGKPLFMIGTIQDITERKKAAELVAKALNEKEILIKEIHHRVKNNLQMIQSLIHLQSQGLSDPDVQRLFDETCGRMATIALIHEQLYLAEDLARIDFKKYLESFMPKVIGNYGEGRIAFSLETDSLLLSVNIAIPCALILNELVSNALKYAFPDSKKGLIKVALKKNTTEEIIMIVSDNGIGIPPHVNLNSTKTLGLELVQVLTKQLHGTLELCRLDGTKFMITFSDKGSRHG